MYRQIFSVVTLLLASFQVFAMDSETLESRHPALWQQNAATEIFRDFKEYLPPNELNPRRLKPIFDELDPGILLTTGTERIFIAASLCNTCSGVIGRDINPRVKAYNDFNLLLLKLASSREDYLYLRAVSAVIALTQENDKAFWSHKVRKRLDYANLVDEIRARLSHSTMADDAKSYYLTNLEAYAHVFYAAQQQDAMLTLTDPEKIVCRNFSAERFFEGANYLFEDHLFSRVQMLAQSGNMIFTVGKIDDIEPFLDEPIKCIDSSNISDYVDLNFSRFPTLQGATHVQAQYQGIACRYLPSKI